MEKNNNILEKYIHGSINEEEYKELQQKIQDDSDRSIPNMLDECWQKDMNIHVMPPSAKERTRRRIDEEIKKDQTDVAEAGIYRCRFSADTDPDFLHRLSLP